MNQFLTIFMVFLTFFLNFAFASNAKVNNDLYYAPKALLHWQKKLVFTDIQHIDVHWKVDKNLKFVEALAQVTFKTAETGYPIFMLNPNTKVKLNGQEISLKKIDQDFNKKRNLYYLESAISAGDLTTLTLEYSFESYSHPDRDSKNRHSHFLPVMYYAHSFTESGIPTNLQYDHYEVDLQITLEKSDDIFVISNGVQNQIKNDYFIRFPKTFTGASFYIDLVRKDQILVEKQTFKSNGRDIPVTVYAEKDDSASPLVNTFMSILKVSFTNLEKKFGDYPFDQIIFKPNNRLNKYSGGAFAGAMALPEPYLEAVTHELGHSWFGHYFSPANGNDQWIYEGMGNWLPLLRTVSHLKDQNYYKFYNLSENPYAIWKTFDAHGIGTSILQTIDANIRAKSQNEEFKTNGLPAVFKSLMQKYPARTVSTRDLEKMLTQETGINFKEVFDFYFL